MNMYFVSNENMEKSSSMLSTYINRIAFGYLTRRSVVWMKRTSKNMDAYRILDRELQLSAKGIPCYHGLLLPEDLLWKDLEHLFIIGSPAELIHMIGLLLPEREQKSDGLLSRNSAWIYLIQLNRTEGNHLLFNDFGYYYKDNNQ